MKQRLTNEIWKTKPIKKFRNVAKKIRLNTESLYAELQALHEGRLVRKLGANKLTVMKLRKVITQEQSYRSRVLAIWMQTKRPLDQLQALEDNICLWIVTNSQYADLLPVTTKTDRYAYLREGLREQYPILTELVEIVDVADYILEDIDKAAWNIKLLVSTFEVATRPDLNL